MEICCDLEVDVNGEETFMVDKVLSMLCSLCLSISFSSKYLCKNALFTPNFCSVYFV
jgi:hypothetical protein